MLIINNEEALRVTCEDVTIEEVASIRLALDTELQRCARLGRPGIGLAAPQIGIAKKMAIVRLDGLEIDLVNSKIENGYDEKTFMNEGCLSFPGRVENTKRFQQIHVTGDTKFIASGMLAVVCQHEIDHFNQKLFFDGAIPKSSKIGPNENCPCGKVNYLTGKIFKYKKCCNK